MPIESDVSISEVQDQSGNDVPPANENEQTKTNSRLGNFPNGYDNTLAPADTNIHQLTAASVPHGVEVLVQADPGNSSPVKVGLTSSPAVRLKPGQSYTAKVQDRSQIRYQLETSTDSVHVNHEVA